MFEVLLLIILTMFGLLILLTFIRVSQLHVRTNQLECKLAEVDALVLKITLKLT